MLFIIGILNTWYVMISIAGFFNAFIDLCLTTFPFLLQHWRSLNVEIRVKLIMSRSTANAFQRNSEDSHEMCQKRS